MVVASLAEFRVKTGGGAVASSRLKLVLLARNAFALFSRHCSERFSFSSNVELGSEVLRPLGTFEVKLAPADAEAVSA